jgi:hypothetical protein
VIPAGAETAARIGGKPISVTAGRADLAKESGDEHVEDVKMQGKQDELQVDVADGGGLTSTTTT